MFDITAKNQEFCDRRAKNDADNRSSKRHELLNFFEMCGLTEGVRGDYLKKDTRIIPPFGNKQWHFSVNFDMVAPNDENGFMAWLCVNSQTEEFDIPIYNTWSCEWLGDDSFSAAKSLWLSSEFCSVDNFWLFINRILTGQFSVDYERHQWEQENAPYAPKYVFTGNTLPEILADVMKALYAQGNE